MVKDENGRITITMPKDEADALQKRIAEGLEPCPCNQRCVRGNCVCPQGKKNDAEGCCVDCLPGDIHPENKCLIS